MGNAAHALHPVAGQGFNLALRDVAELAAVLARGASQGRPLVTSALLQHYLRRQQSDQDRTIQFSDRLPGLFMHTDPVLGLARDLALSGLDILPPLKREFVRHAAGVAAWPTPWAQLLAPTRKDGAMAEIRRFDVAIIGAGIAGSALATALSGKGLAIALVEAQSLAPPELPVECDLHHFDPGSARSRRGRRHCYRTSGRGRR